MSSSVVVEFPFINSYQMENDEICESCSEGAYSTLLVSSILRLPSVL